MEAGSFWNDQDTAKATIAELKTLNGVLKPFEALVSQADDLSTLIEMAEEVGMARSTARSARP
jgi:peptide chain release factor 2